MKELKNGSNDIRMSLYYIKMIIFKKSSVHADYWTFTILVIIINNVNKPHD